MDGIGALSEHIAARKREKEDEALVRAVFSGQRCGRNNVSQLPVGGIRWSGGKE
jgi:hypothetical protein